MPDVLDIYKRKLMEAWKDQAGHVDTTRKELISQIKEMEDKISYIRELLASRKLDPEDFREMKSDYAQKLDKLEAKLNAFNGDQPDMQDLLKKGLANLLKLDYLFTSKDCEAKQRMISSIYPENLVFDGDRFRTNRTNEVVKSIYMINK